MKQTSKGYPLESCPFEQRNANMLSQDFSGLKFIWPFRYKFRKEIKKNFLKVSRPEIETDLSVLTKTLLECETNINCQLNKDFGSYVTIYS